MKVALLTPTFFEFSGIDRVVERQAKDLILNGDTVAIFTFEATMEPPHNVRLEILGMPKNPFWQRVYRLFFPLDFIKAMKWVPKLKDFDIIYSHQYPMNWLACLSKRFYGKEYIYYDYGIALPETFSNFVERTYMKILAFLVRRTVRKADGAISISHYLHKQLKDETGLISTVVYPLIDEERFHSGLDGTIIRRKYNLTKEPIVLYVGRISPHKGVHLLIRAFNLLRQEIPNARLFIVGKHTFPGYSSALRKISDDSVVFADSVTDEELPLFYAACDVYATGTLWEGFDLPLAEAQACGKPVVAFDIGPHPEVVQSTDAGTLVSPEDITEMSGAIKKLLKKDSSWK